MIPTRFNRLSSAVSGAFSLIELLVVILIIAVLAALIFPAFKGVMENTKRTNCINNQRQILSGMISYSTDNAGFLPSCGWDGGTGNSSAEHLGWLYGGKKVQQPAANEKPPNFDQKYYVDGSIWKYIKTPKVYFCPYDRPTKAEFQQRNVKITSYCMNGAVNYYQGSTASARISDFPSNAILLWEQQDGPAGFFFNDSSNRPDEGISERHVDGAMVGCFDGRVEWLTRAQYAKELTKPGPDYPQDPKQAIGPNRFWCNPTSGSGNGR